MTNIPQMTPVHFFHGFKILIEKSYMKIFNIQHEHINIDTVFYCWLCVGLAIWFVVQDLPNLNI